MPCGTARGATDEELQAINAQFIGPEDLADLMAEADKVLSF
jgi:hypothetical protein